MTVLQQYLSMLSEARQEMQQWSKSTPEWAKASKVTDELIEKAEVVKQGLQAGIKPEVILEIVRNGKLK